ncbi:MAG: hypothetical protein KJ067_07200 [Vicinamibacteria bacterium]|nr:hypothetical protein [Vicinamibacteria bacterium]
MTTEPESNGIVQAGVESIDSRTRTVPARPFFDKLWMASPGFEVVSVDYGVARQRREALHAWALFVMDGGDYEVRPMVAGPSGRLLDAFQVYAESTSSAIVGVYRIGQQPPDADLAAALGTLERKWRTR